MEPINTLRKMALVITVIVMVLALGCTSVNADHTWGGDVKSPQILPAVDDGGWDDPVTSPPRNKYKDHTWGGEDPNTPLQSPPQGKDPNWFDEDPWDVNSIHFLWWIIYIH